MNDKLLNYLALTWMVKRGGRICFYQGDFDEIPEHLIVVVC
jgi:hypothetical protein